MEHNGQLEGDPQVAVHKPQALVVRTGVRAGVESTSNTTPEGVDAISQEWQDIRNALKNIGASLRPSVK